MTRPRLQAAKNFQAGMRNAPAIIPDDIKNKRENGKIKDAHPPQRFNPRSTGIYRYCRLPARDRCGQSGSL